MPFTDRAEAGERLATALTAYKGSDAVVLALPRGGVPVGAPVAQQLHAPLDVLLVRKIGVPSQPELAMGAIVDGSEPVIVRNERIIRMASISPAEFERACRTERSELERRRRVYVGDRRPADVRGRTVILVDDGVATGATMRAAIRGLRLREPDRIVVAVPVAPPDTVAALEEEADAVICLEQPADFQAIGQYYEDFRQLDDNRVVGLMAEAASRAEPLHQ